MAKKLAVEIIGDAASLKATLGSAAAATKKFGIDVESQFAGMSTAALRASYSMDKLSIATARYGVGTTGAAKATIAYRREIEALSAAQMRAMQNVGRSLSTYVTLPTILLGYEAVKMGVSFSQNMTMIQTQAGASAAEVHKLSGEVLQLAKSSPQGPTELAKGLYHLESLGLRGSEAMKALRTSSIAAGMGIANIEDVATAFGGAVVSNIKGTENFEKAMGTLNATIGVGNMRMEDLVGALGTGLLPAAKNAGLSLDQVGAALAVLTDRGISAENAGTRLRMTFALMQAPSDKAVKALADMGISAEDMAKQLRGPNGLYNVLSMLHGAMQRVGKVRGSTDILHAFGGGRSGAGILTLVQSLDSSISSYQGKLAQIQRDQGKFSENMKVYMASPAYKLHVALSTVESDLTKLGQSLTPAVVGLSKVVSTVADAFTALPGPIKQDLGAIIGILAVGGPLLLAVAGVKKMVLSMGGAFGTMAVEGAAGVAAVDAEMVTMQGTVATTSAEVATLRGRLLGLGKLGPIALVIALSFVPGDKKGKQLLGQGPMGGFGSFLGNLPFGIGNVAQQGAALGRETRMAVGGSDPLKKGQQKVKRTFQQTMDFYLSNDDLTFRRKSNGDLEVVGPGGKVYRTYKWNTPGTGVAQMRASLPAFEQRGAAQDYAKYLKRTKEGDILPPPVHHGPVTPAPKTELPRWMKEAEYWADISDSLPEKLKVAKEEEAFFAKQLKLAKKGSDTYDTILQNMDQAHNSVVSIQSQINTQRKKANKVSFKLPPSLSIALSKATASGDGGQEIKALNSIKNWLTKKIAGEKNLAKKALEEKALSHTMTQIKSVRKEVGKKLIDALQGDVDMASTTTGLSDDISSLTKLRNAIVKQIGLQKNNNDLMNQLTAVDKKFAQMREQIASDLHGTFGALGQGPEINPSSDPMLQWFLGVRHSAQDYIKDLQRQMSEFKTVQGDINKLIKAGAPSALIDELRGQGMAAFPELFALAHADKGTLKKFFEAFNDREKEIMKTATATINADTVIIRAGKLGSNLPVGALMGGTTGPSLSGTQIPHMATGGIVSRPTLALIGERGPEAVVPLSSMSGGPPQVIELYIDGRQVESVVVSPMQRRSGRNSKQQRGRYGGRNIF